MKVELHRTNQADLPTADSLFQLYLEEVSQWITRYQPGPDGRYPAAQLMRYFTEPEHEAWLILAGGNAVGLALIRGFDRAGLHL